jgi:predicted phosphodiesterase
VNRRGIDGVVAAVERDARERVPVFAWQVLTAGTIGAAVLGLLAFRSRWRLVATCVVAAVIGVTSSEVLVLSTFTPSAFTEPTYSGSLALAPKVIGPVREATNRIQDFRAGLSQIVDASVRAYSTIQTAPIDEDAIRVLHISDVHVSPLGMDYAREIAEAFDVDLVVDTGDLTSFATPIEDLITTQIPLFGRPYVYVRGNHDTRTLQAEIARLPNAIVLDGGQARTIAGLTVYGLGHPAFTPARGIPTEGVAFAELARSVGPRVLADVEAADASGEPVDLVAVHDDRMAEAVAGQAPVVISGHFHNTVSTVVNGTLFLRIGTTGGSGAGIFRGLEDIPFSAEVLYFSREEEPKLIAYDVVDQLPESGSLTVQRVNIAEEYGELVLTPSPSSSSSSSSPTPATGTTGPTGTSSP